MNEAKPSLLRRNCHVPFRFLVSIPRNSYQTLTSFIICRVLYRNTPFAVAMKIQQVRLRFTIDVPVPHPVFLRFS